MLRQPESPQGLAVSYVISHAELQLGRKLGQGGFGVVYQGTFRHNDVAIKQLLMENISREAAEEFSAEAKVMAELRSPNIVQFYGFCVSPNYCIVMEYMPNGSLFSILRSDRHLEWPTRFRIAVDIAKGLSYLHHENILHRDIKSLNVLLDEHDRAKLTDFGLSKVKNETRSHAVATKTKSDSVGTTQWMAPELFKGRKAVFTSKSDIYSLAVTFWEIASRKIPFSDASSPDLIPTWVQHGDREDIPTDCPPALSALIQACWKGDPNERPSADDIVARLKSAIEAFSSSAALSSSARYADNFYSAQPSGPQYRDNFGSETGSARAPAPQVPQALPPRLAPAVPPTPIVRQVPTPQMAQLAIMPQIDANAVHQLLKLVAEGEQDQAEKMLKANPALALAANDVTDLSNRTFKNITAFQYAVWALDWHMWTMIRKYLPNDIAREQIQNMETALWVSQHGKSASWQNLIAALEKFISLYNKAEFDRSSPCKEATICWQKEVGGAQRLLPAHVINEYCHTSRSFEYPDFTAPDRLPRSRELGYGEWFKSNKGNLGGECGIFRGTWWQAMGIFHWKKEQDAFKEPVAIGLHYETDSEQREFLIGTNHYLNTDLNACRKLLETRTKQRDQLIVDLTMQKQPLTFQLAPKTTVLAASSQPAEPINPKDLSAFLRLVAEGEQDQVEAMLQKNKSLALSLGDVTDLSGRTFTSITGFQYAIWALDWRMWMMIRQYLPHEAAHEQLLAIDTAPWSSPLQHDKSASWQNLLSALTKYHDLCEGYQDWSRAEKCWQQEVGYAQRLLPAHVINEYCDLSHGFSNNSFTPGSAHRVVLNKLSRSRIIKEGEWFTAVYNGGRLGDKFGIYRRKKEIYAERVHHPWQVSGKREHLETRENCAALQALFDTRVQQRDLLVIALTDGKRRRYNIGSEATSQKPLTFSSAPKPNLTLAPSAPEPVQSVRQVPSSQSSAVEQVWPTPQIAQLAITAPRVNPAVVLRLVAEGEQAQIEAMLKANKDLTLVAGDITDLSDRTFKNITAFQYAVWALDWHMWTMIRKHLPDDSAREQIQSMATAPWVSQHGQSASWQNLIDALQKCIDLCNQSQYTKANEHWVKVVGDAQRLLPAHVINEYCHSKRSFSPCPNFTQPEPNAVWRTRQTKYGEWFTCKLHTSEGVLSRKKLAVLRGEGSHASPTPSIATTDSGYKYEYGNETNDSELKLDVLGLRTLLDARLQQRQELLKELVPRRSLTMQ